jgi:hypothetical protein
MKGRWRSLGRGVLKALELLLFVVLFSILVLFPIIKDINRLKREKKDLELKILDIQQAAYRFSLPDERERSLFREEDHVLRQAAPSVQTEADLQVLIGRVDRYIQNLARLQGIREKEYLLTAAGGTIRASDQAAELQEFRNFIAAYLKESQPQPGEEHDEDSFFTPRGLNYCRLWLFWTAGMSRALPFLNRLTWENEYVAPDEILVSEGGQYPLFAVGLRLYFLDKRRQPPSSSRVKRPEESTDMYADYHSPMLLERVYRHWPQRFGKRELTDMGGKTLFVKGRE